MPDARSILLAAAALTLTVGITACGSAPESTKPDPTSVSISTAQVSTRSADPVRHRVRGVEAVRVARTAYGPALVNRRGFALYLFTHDAGAGSTCYGACATAWPPYVVSKRPSNAARGTHARLVGSVRRRDGRLQVTYKGHPLYFYVGDRRPGQVLCQAVPEFGGTWYVVAPSGDAIH